MAGAAACQNEEITPDNSGREEILLGAGSMTATVSTAPQTRAGGTTEAFTGKAIDVIMRDNRSITTGKHGDVSMSITTASDTYNADQSEISGVAPAKVILNPKQYWDDWGGKDGSINFIGVYPQGKTTNGSDDITWTVQTDQSASGKYDASDLLLAYRGAYDFEHRKNAANLVTPANLHFQHVMAKITLNIKKGEGWGASESFDPKVKIVSVNYKGTIGITPTTSGNDPVQPEDYTIEGQELINNASGPKEITPFVSTTPTSGYAKTVSAIIVPTISGITNNTEIATVTVGANTYSIKASEAAAKGFAAGVNTVFNVTVNKLGVLVSATIKDWDNGGEINQSVNISVGSGQTGDSGVTPDNGSVLFATINNVSTTYTKGASGWTTNSPIYWDNVKFNGGNVTPSAVLINATDSDTEANRKDAEKVFKGNAAVISSPVSNICFNSMIHPMAKVTIIIRSLETTTGGVVPIDLGTDGANIQEVTLKGQQEYENCTSGTNAFTYKAQADIKKANKKANTTDADYYAYEFDPIYVKPNTSALTSGNALVEAVVTINSIPNTYILKVPATPATQFKENGNYTIIMTISKTEVGALVTINPWTENGTIGGDGSLTN